MVIKMDTDAVRAMSSRIRQSADVIDSKLASINSSVNSAEWQSQAREEFVMRVGTLNQSISQSSTVLRMMAHAAEKKAEQWEVITGMLNGPFHFLTGVWSSVLAYFNRIGTGLWNSISNIHIPSIPHWVFPSISGASIIGGISKLVPDWEWKAPSWWPFNKPGNNEYHSGGGSGGSGGGAWGEADGDNAEDISQGSGSSGTTPSQPVEDKPYPQPPTSPKLEEADGKPSNYTCATYARDRRPDLGSTQSNNEKYADGAAANYISKFEDKAFQIDNSGDNLEDIIGPGYALVWEPDHPSANSTYGHVAIIEEVYADHVVISEAARVNGVYQIKTRTISIDQLNNDSVWLIP